MHWFLSGAWGFITSRLGSILVALAVGYSGGYYKASDRSAEKAHTLQLEADLAQVSAALEVKETDLNIARMAEAQAKEASRQLELQTITDQETIDELKSALSARPDRRACAVTSDDIRRLLNIDAGENRGPKGSPP